jgi:hypothetical protein
LKNASTSTRSISRMSTVLSKVPTKSSNYVVLCGAVLYCRCAA